VFFCYALTFVPVTMAFLYGHAVQMEQSVAPLLKSGRRTTHQFALRLVCLLIYGLINDGAWRMGRWRLAS